MTWMRCIMMPSMCIIKYDATINNDLAPSTAMEIHKDYNKAVFYLSYIISVELKKYMEKVEEILYSSRIEVLSPERLLAQQEDMKVQLSQFKEHYRQNYKYLCAKEDAKLQVAKF